MKTVLLFARNGLEMPRRLQQTVAVKFLSLLTGGRNPARSFLHRGRKLV